MELYDIPLIEDSEVGYLTGKGSRNDPPTSDQIKAIDEIIAKMAKEYNKNDA